MGVVLWIFCFGGIFHLAGTLFVAVPPVAGRFAQDSSFEGLIFGEEFSFEELALEGIFSF